MDKESRTPLSETGFSTNEEWTEPTKQEVDLIMAFIRLQIGEDTLNRLRNAGYGIDDLFQEFSLLLPKIRKGYNKDRGGYSTYIYGSLKRSLIDLLRFIGAKQRHGRRTSIDKSLNTLADPSFGPEKMERIALQKQVLGKVFRKDNPFGLSDRELEVLRAVILEGLEPVDYAKRAGIKKNVARVRFSHAIRKIRKILLGQAE